MSRRTPLALALSAAVAAAAAAAAALPLAALGSPLAAQALPCKFAPKGGWTFCPKANLAGRDLTTKDFGGAYVRGANFAGAKLAGVNFYNANASLANFSKADASGASCYQQHFQTIIIHFYTINAFGKS